MSILMTKNSAFLNGEKECTLGVIAIKVYTSEFQISWEISRILGKISRISGNMRHFTGKNWSNFS